MSKWNTLPLVIRQSENIHIFKEKLIVNSNFVCGNPRLGESYTPNFVIIVHLIVLYFGAMLLTVGSVHVADWMKPTITLLPVLNILPRNISN